MSWRIGVSTGACIDAPILEMLPALKDSGAGGLEIGTPPRHFDPLDPAHLEPLAQALALDHLPAVSIHAPFGGVLDLASPDEEQRKAAIAAALKCADVITHLGGQLVIVHPSDLVRHEHNASARLHDSLASLRTISEACNHVGARLVIESPLPHLVGGDPREFAWLLAGLDASVGVCLDTGHTWLGHHWEKFVAVSGRRLIHIHANDNHGSWDDHLPPGDGTIDWGTVASSLRDVSFDGWIMLELRCPSDDRRAYFTRAFNQLSELLGTPAARGEPSTRTGVVP